MSQSLPDMVLRRSGTSPGRRQPEQALLRTRRETAAALAHVPLFAGFSKRALHRLAKDTDVVSFATGQKIVEEGDVGRGDVRGLVRRGYVLKGKRRLGTMRARGVLRRGGRARRLAPKRHGGCRDTARGAPALPPDPLTALGSRAAAGDQDAWTASSVGRVSADQPARRLAGQDGFDRRQRVADPTRGHPRPHCLVRGRGRGCRRSPMSRPAGPRSMRAPAGPW